MRRNLILKCLDDAVIESETLLKTGYTKSGNWSLGQICCHLRRTIEANMRGYPKWMVFLGYPLRPMLRIFALPRILAGASPSGVPTAGMFVPSEQLEDSIEVQRFKECVAAFRSSNAPLHPHPGFGDMTHDQFDHFHAAHAAHHFGFLHPTGSDTHV